MGVGSYKKFSPQYFVLIRTARLIEPWALEKLYTVVEV